MGKCPLVSNPPSLIMQEVKCYLIITKNTIKLLKVKGCYSRFHSHVLDYCQWLRWSFYPRMPHKQIELLGITSTTGNFRPYQIQTANIHFKLQSQSGFRSWKDADWIQCYFSLRHMSRMYNQRQAQLCKTNLYPLKFWNATEIEPSDYYLTFSYRCTYMYCTILYRQFHENILSVTPIISVFCNQNATVIYNQ